MQDSVTKRTESRRAARQRLATLNVAFRYHRKGYLDDAQYLYRQILNDAPNDPAALHGLAVIEAARGRTEQALKYLRQAIAVTPRASRLHNTCGLLLEAIGHAGEAIESYRRAIGINPDFAEAYTNLAVALVAGGDFNAVVHHAERAVSINPEDALAYNTLGYGLEMLGRLEEAVAAYQRAVELNPTYAEAHNHLGVTLNSLRRYDEALESYNRAIEIDPDYAEARWNRSLVLLLKGQYKQGWSDYNYRYDKDIDLSLYGRQLKCPLWRGGPLDGRTLLVHYEQGMGDSIQFVRYLPMLRNAGGRILLEVQSGLVELFRHSPADYVIDEREDNNDLPQHDLHVSLMNLPGLFTTTVETIPKSVPYIHADPVKVEYWRNRLAGHRLKVGVVWSGSALYERNAVRSCRLADFGALASIPNVSFYSLQKGEPTEQLEQDHGMDIEDLGSELMDLSDTAAVIANLDLLVTVDTCILHLAGAMGKRTWGVMCAEPGWQWMLEREDSPWYPTIRLFRQKQPYEWSDVFERINAELTELARNHSARAVKAVVCA